jgi:nucleoside-diphosphate-sugar epimerase
VEAVTDAATGPGPPRRAVVTGATGFIGRHLTERLVADGWEVTALVRDEAAADLGCAVVRWPTSGDGLVAVFEDAAPQVCFHLATRFQTNHTPADVVPLVDGNVTLAALVGEAAASVPGCRVVNTGTYWQHFEGADYHPTNLYAAMKQASEDVLRFYALVGGVPLVTAVIFNAFGPGEPARRITSLLVDAALTGEPLGASPGGQLVDLLYVDDVVTGLVQAATLDLAEPASRFEVCSGRLVRIQDVADAVAEAVGRAPQVEWGARPYGPGEMFERWPVADPLPGFTPRVSLVEGLEALAAPRRAALGLA